MSKLEQVITSSAPQPLGPYSQAIKAGGFVFVAGQVALDPSTGQLVSKGNIAAQTKQTLKNMEAVLAAAGSSLSQVTKVTVFMADFTQFDDMNAVYASIMPDPKPARSTVEIKSLPFDLLVEIECIACT
jgi:2-iminobutanoate/2-iminopropanoate deaminase